MFKKILIGVAAIIVLFLIVVALRPSDFRVSRSATIAAAAPEIFALVNNFHNWEAWSPWAKLDPNAKMTFEGPDEGTVKCSWAGNSSVGEGSMTITESNPSDLIRIKLEFIKPFAGTSDAQFTFEPKGDDTLVTWSMSGKNNFMAKAIGLFIDCDKMIGGNFEQGLASIKSIVEVPKEK